MGACGFGRRPPDAARGGDGSRDGARSGRGSSQADDGLGRPEGGYRLLDRPEATLEAVTAPHGHGVGVAATTASGPMLFVHDDTTIDLTRHNAMQGARPHRQRGGFGCLAHTCLALAPAPAGASILGLARQTAGVLVDAERLGTGASLRPKQDSLLIERTGAMAGRIVAIALLVVMLGTAAAFMAVAFLGPPDEPWIADPGSGVSAGVAATGNQTFIRSLGSWRLNGNLIVARDGAYELTFSLVDGAGRPAPTSVVPSLRVNMADHVMDPVSPPVEPEGPGAYRAAGTLDMEGRWRFRIAFGETTTSVVVVFQR